MGRIFEKRKTTMFARWNRVSRQFARIAKEIVIAAKSGSPEPENNPALRRAVQNARAVNMPKDRIEAAIRRTTGQDAVDYQEVLYEGYGPHGIALVVETATDNPTRTVANVRSAFKTHGGNLGTQGSVSFQFRHMGVFRVVATGLDADDLELALIDHGLEELREGAGDDDQPQFILRCAFSDLGSMQRALEERGIHPAFSGSDYVCTAPITLSEEHEKDVLALIDALEQDDDVQRVFHALA